MMILYQDKSQSSGRVSPTLDDLEERKRRLLDALEGDGDIVSIGSAVSISDIGEPEIETVKDKESADNTEEKNSDGIEVKEAVETKESVSNNENLSVDVELNDTDAASTSINSPNVDNKSIGTTDSDSDLTKNPDSKGRVKTTSYGTPVMNIASSFKKLPTDDKFSKDICDVINFENLPNSIGKYKQISTLLKKVKGEVDRIQDS